MTAGTVDRQADNWIGGQWRASDERMTAVSPSTGRTIASLPRSSREDARAAIASARKAYEYWSEVPVWERSDACMRIALEIEKRSEAIAAMLSLEQGKPRAEALGEVGAAVSGFRLAAEEIKHLGGETIPTEDGGKLALTIRQPRGIFAVITPWNFPVNIPVEYLAPAIATGNTVVWTPAPTTSLCAIELAKAIEAANLPAGVVNLVIGEGPVVGDEIVANPGTDGIGFTGSTQTGHRIAERGAGKQMLLELGGNGPVIVFEDADLDRAAAATAGGAFFNSGQVCSATERVLVHANVAEAFSQKVVEIARAKVLGDPSEDGVDMGPLNNASVAAKTREHIEDAVSQGAIVAFGGKSRAYLGSDLFFEPTVLTGVTREMRINREETFGPVVPVLTFETDEEALDLALDNDYGLSSSIFTADLGRALHFGKKLRAGIVNVNEAPSYWELHLPFGGGAGKKSGVGRIGGRHTLEAMTVIKTIVLQA